MSEIKNVDKESSVDDKSENKSGVYANYGSYFDKEEDLSGRKIGIASVICGSIGVLISFIPFIGLIPAVLAIIFGCIGMKYVNRGVAVAGLSLGIVAALPQIFLMILIFMRTIKPFN
ncbi:MAG: hypothetical protein ACRCSG_04185 [Cellulosilyticaceae bacterium]